MACFKRMSKDKKRLNEDQSHQPQEKQEQLKSKTMNKMKCILHEIICLLFKKKESFYSLLAIIAYKSGFKSFFKFFDHLDRRIDEK